MQTILGAGGVIGNGLIDELSRYTKKIRVVSRNTKSEKLNIEKVKADLTNFEQVDNAVEGSEIVYLTVGLQYSYKIWSVQWPLIMNNVINACIKHKCKLVFLDNVYMLGKVNGIMTEETPVNPCSKKGEIRAAIAQRILDEIKFGKLTALIARSADFYGPGALNSGYHMMICENFKNKKSASLICNDSSKHSYTYTPDAVKGIALLGNTPEAYNQIWHLPTDKNALTSKEMLLLTAKEFGVEPKYKVLKKWMIKLAGMFNPLISEVYEMLYQNEFDYLFDSTKFEKAFSIKPTTYKEGIKATVAQYK